jgi:hypothetical protein
MSDVAAYHVFECALFPVQGGMWVVDTISVVVGVQYSLNWDGILVDYF